MDHRESRDRPCWLIPSPNRGIRIHLAVGIHVGIGNIKRSCQWINVASKIAVLMVGNVDNIGTPIVDVELAGDGPILGKGPTHHFIFVT
jgi:hypothetical protein